jgi:hypothetical protein
MNIKKYIMLMALFIGGLSMSCRDESLYPLPYNDRTVGAYLRMYVVTSNIFDLNDLANSAFDAIYESVDENGGTNLDRVEFYASFRRGTGLSSEVLVKTISGSDFAPVPEPTYSEYVRARIKITANETLTALASAPAPPATWPSGSVGLAYPGTLIAADQIVYRWQMVLKDGRKFSVLNPQRTNVAENNNTPNITTGQFYSAPFTYTIVARSLIAGSWIGDYALTQIAIWSPNHSVALHASSFPAYMNQVLFPNQNVTLSIPSGGLSTEREFTVNYRGSNVKMRINLENGTVFVPLQNTTVDCTSEREIYWVTPVAGSFAGNTTLPAGLPQTTISNRGSYSTTSSGLTTGNTMTIGVDDDADEYGRRNGYCTWTRRISLRLTKL